MELLKNHSGYSLIEMLVCISLLGIIILVSTSVYIRTFSNPKIIFRSEALFLANQEINNALHNKLFRDTAYTIDKSLLMVERKVKENKGLIYLDVSILYGVQKKEIAKLSVGVVK